MSYRLQKDVGDDRDFVYTPTDKPLRDVVDLRNWASPVEDQNLLGSCTANAIVGAYELLTIKEFPKKFVDLSRLFVYYNTRILEETINEDSGAYLRNGIKAVNRYGICTESLWPYDINKFKIKPSAESYEDAKYRNIKNYYRVDSNDNILDALNNDIPVVIGILVYESFDALDKDNYILNLPSDTELSMGGHAMVIVGYDLPKKLFLVRNSFGVDWCIDGYCWITFAYMEQELLDAWIFDINLMS